MGNVPVNGPYPAVQYEPTESPPTGIPVYHEDREVTLSVVIGSQMFRTYNAQFTSGIGWELNNNGLAAYATVQNPDGSIHYFTMPAGSAPWTSWAGSGNNAVYNAVDFGLVSGTGLSQTQRAANVAAIQNAVNAAIALIDENTGGGTVVLGGHSKAASRGHLKTGQRSVAT